MPDVTDRRFEAALVTADEFFMKSGPVHRALLQLARRLDDAGVPYAIVGAMALNAYGYERMTTDVDILVTREGLETFKRANLGRGYVEKFEGSLGLRDTEHGVPIDVLIAGEYPGDGRPKPVSFPDPSSIALEGERFRILPLATLVELKLASGMTAPHRLKDLADVLEVIRALRLTDQFAESLHPYVRAKYLELWQAAQSADVDTE